MNTKRLGIAVVCVAAMFVLGGVTGASASVYPPLACYKVMTAKTGNYSNSTCTTKVEELTGEYVLAEPTKWLDENGEENLWCAKLTPEEEAGRYKNSACTEEKVHGEYAVIDVPKITLAEWPTVETRASSSQTVTSEFENKGAGLLEGKIVSTSLKAEMDMTSKKEGTFHIDFENSECKATLAAGKANSKGDATGAVLVLGTYKIVGIAGTNAYVVLEIDPVEIECGAQTIEVKGGVIGSFAKERTKGTSFTLTVKAPEGKQAITEYLNDDTEPVTVGLKTTVLSKEGPSTQNESAAVTIATEKETELT